MIYDLLWKLVTGQSLDLHLYAENTHIILIMFIGILQGFLDAFQFSQAAFKGNYIHQSRVLVNA